MKKENRDSAVYSQNWVESLLNLIHLTEHISTKIHGVRNRDDIFDTIEKEFMQSKQYTCGLLLFNNDKSGLHIIKYSQARKIITAAERACKTKISDIVFYLKDAPNFSKVVRNGETINLGVNDMMQEMFSGSMAKILGGILGLTRRMCIVTPLNKKDGCIGAFVMSSMGLGDKLIPSVRHFAENISVALELADEAREREIIRISLKESEELLRIEREALKEKNITLKEILKQIESEKKSIEYQFANNVERVILPIVDKLKMRASSLENEYLDLIEKNLREITSPFLSRLTVKYDKLTHREIEVCNMIKNGLSSKEIAAFLNISVLTVNRHREFIRKKFEINQKDISLPSFLNSIELNQ